MAEIRSNEQLKAVGRIAAWLAHEIKNPLSSIKTFTEHLEAHYAEPQFRAKFQKIVGGEVERINLIVQQLLEFAKPVPPRLTPVDVPRLLDETVELLGSELVQRHVEVTRRYEGRDDVLGDPQQLKQVFLNLLLNGLQAMTPPPAGVAEGDLPRSGSAVGAPAGGGVNGSGRLEIRTARRGATLEVTIADNGAGIASQDLPRIFEPFYTTKATGTGLGLAVVQSIVKEHGGRIRVESHPGQGTTFALSLPIAV